MLNPGVSEYIKIAEFDERINDERPAPSKPGLIRLHFPINPLSDGNSYTDAGPYKLSLKLTAAESGAAKIRCCLCVENGFLKLRRIEQQPEPTMKDITNAIRAYFKRRTMEVGDN
jgi:hypothetical protein